MLVNNVGISIPNKSTLESDPADIESIIKTNVFSYVMMTKHFLQEAKTYRSKDQSFIIYLSSVVADIRNPNRNGFYQATKLQNKVFANYLYYPSSFRVDRLVLKPGWVSTPLTHNRKVDAFTASLEQESSAIMKCIGFTRETYGQYKHLGMMLILGSVPEPVFHY